MAGRFHESRRARRKPGGLMFPDFRRPRCTGGLLWILTLGFALQLRGDGPREFLIRNWTRDDGLPGNTVTSLAQTPDGYLWVGTFGGLARFDGVKFTVVDLQKLAGLHAPGVTCLAADPGGVLWIGLDEGRVLRCERGVFTVLDPPSHQTGQRSLRAIWPDRSGMLWTLNFEGVLNATAGGGFRTAGERPGFQGIIEDNAGQLWVAAGPELLTISGTDLSVQWDASRDTNFSAEALAPSRDGGCWVGGRGRLRRFEGARQTLELQLPETGQAALSAVLEDRGRNLWAATYGAGIIQVNPSGANHHLDRDNGLASNLVRCLLEDQEGNIWAGLEGKGLARVRPAAFASFGRGEGFSGEAVLCVCEDSKGTIWVGSNGNGVKRIQAGRVWHYGEAEGLTNPFVWALHCDRAGRLWAGTWGSGLFRLENDRFVNVGPEIGATPVVLAIHQDQKGSLWLGQRLDSERRIDAVAGRERLSYSIEGAFSRIDVRCIAETRDGTIWLGTTEELLCGKDRVFAKCDTGSGLPQGPISAMEVDEEGGLWIGVVGHGLVRWENERFTVFPTTRTLLDDNLNQITDDGLGYLWCGLRSGVIRLRKEDLHHSAQNPEAPLEWQRFSQSDGLPAKECTGSGCRARDGRIWFATSAGVAVVDPHQVPPRMSAPVVMVESVMLSGRPVAAPPVGRAAGFAAILQAPDRVIVPPGGGLLEIAYTALNFTTPEQIQFRYRVAGLPGSEVDAGADRVARYNYLPPGKYAFEVTARFEGGPWNQPWVRVPVEVLPRYWQTGWFQTLAVGLALTGAVVAARFFLVRRLRRRLASLEQQRALEEERSRIAQDLHDDLGTSLTEISFLSATAESPNTPSGEIKECLENIRSKSLELVKALDEIVWAVNPKNDSLRNLLNYLCLFAQEFLRTASIQCRLDVPPGLPEFPLNADQRHTVFLVTKEALANAAKHSRATEVWLRAKVDGARLKLVVEDNGCGFDPKNVKTDRNGLKNIENRMRQLGGQSNVCSKMGEGARVELELPVFATRSQPTRV